MGKKHLILFIPIFMGMFLFAESQEIDPFYMRVFNKGETLFKQGNFREAVQELKIAVFGIKGHDEILGKAHVYMGLSYYHLDQKEESEKHLNEAVNFIGAEGISKIELSPETRKHLSQILRHFGIMNLELKAEAAPPQPAEEELSAETASENRINTLEASIKKNPKEADNYYQLTNIYIEKKETKKAIKTLKNLIKQQPLELKALHVLGILHFKEKKFNRAEHYFSRIFTVAKSRGIPSKIMDSCRAYHILSLYYRGEKDRAYELAKQIKSYFTMDKLNSLNLDDNDRRVLSEILMKD